MPEETPENITVIPSGGDGPLSLRDAASSLANWRDDKPEDAPAEPAVEAPTKDTATPAETAPAEPVQETQEASPAEEPSIEPPRSWTKEEKEYFAGLPHEMQERLAERERSREVDFSRRQNEAHQQRQAAEAERQQLGQARAQYEQALPTLLQTLQQAQMADFSDITSMADVEKMAREDWPRYALWDAQQKKVAVVAEELRASQQRQAQEAQDRLRQFAITEEPKLYQEHPELQDKAKMSAAANKAVEYLQGKGLGPLDFEFLRTSGLASAAWFQSLVYNNLKYQEAKAAVKKAEVKPVPKVQRPGVAAPKGEPQDVHLSNLGKKFENNPNWKNAAELLIAQRNRG